MVSKLIDVTFKEESKGFMFMLEKFGKGDADVFVSGITTAANELDSVLVLTDNEEAAVKKIKAAAKESGLTLLKITENN
jgi:hypothetical protein